MIEEEGKRARRSTRFSGDFQMTFGDAGSSDEDVEVEVKKKKGNTPGNSKTKRTKECPGCGAILSLSVRECGLCDYQFTSKSMLVTSQSAAQESTQIREKFPFEPERDEDGSLFIEKIMGRRPRKNASKRWLKTTGVSIADMTAMDGKYDHEYLIKYKNLSYLHVQWFTAQDIEAMSQKSKAALNRYLTKLDRGDSTVSEDPEIEASYTEVEKILDYREEDVQEVVDETAPPTVTAYDEADEEEEEPVPQQETPSKRGANKKPVAALPKKNSSDSLVSMDEEAAPATNGLSKTNSVTTFINADGEEEVVIRSATAVFQAAERCRQVLLKVWEDPYAISFQEPVDTDVYEDYLDVVEEPICLLDVKKTLDSGGYSKFGQYRKFAQDMRKIWRNCKAYNLYKSQIWHSAHALSMLFERLYQSWVISYADGAMEMTDPLARPWELSCRECLQEHNDEQMMLCDHCDAAHHIYCLRPPLAKVPEEAWMCPRCISWFDNHKAKVLSASAEEEARLLVDGALGKKVMRVRKKKYLVKWRGLSYRDCTWETVKDINDDEKIADYHKLNDSPPDEPPLTQAEIGMELAKERKTQLYPAGMHGSSQNPVTDLDAQVYAQIRAYHFIKWNKTVPDALLKESGPFTAAYTHGLRNSMALPAYLKDTIEKVVSSATQMEVEPETASVAETELTQPTASGFSEEKTVESEKTGSAAVHTSESMVSLVTDTAEATADEPMEEDEEEEEPDPEEVLRARKKALLLLDHSTAWYDFSPETVRATVSDLLGDMVYNVARDHRKTTIPPYPSRPDLPYRYKAPSEIEVCVSKGSKSLCVKAGNFNNNFVVLGFKPVEGSGDKGPVERTGRVKIGDILVAINGLYVHDLKFAKILTLLSTQAPYLYLRFLRIPASQESRNPDMVDKYMRGKTVYRSSHRPIPLRSVFFGVYPDPEVAGQWLAEYFRSFAKVRVGQFSDEPSAAVAYDCAIRSLADANERNVNFDEDGNLTSSAKVLGNIVHEERQLTKQRLEMYAEEDEEETGVITEENLASHKQKAAEPKRVVSTLMEIDENDNPVVVEVITHVAESAEKEKGPNDDEEVEVDDFHSLDSRDSDSLVASSSSGSDREDEEDGEAEDSGNEWDSGNEDIDWMPTSKDSGENDGPVVRLLRAVNESDYPPLRSDWTKYILELAIESSATTGLKDRKLEQVDMASEEVIRVWDSAAQAARTQNIPAVEILAVLAGKSDTAGGFKWRFVKGAPGSSSDEVEDDAESEAKKEEVWKLKLPKKSKEYKSGGTLRDYQVEGLNWLLRCWYTKRSSILADEMGLGKTVQVVTFLEHLFDTESIRGPYLVCVPLSTIGHWKREFDLWSQMSVCLYHDVGGGRDMRDVIREFEWYYKGRSRRLLKFHVLITTYDDLTRDYEELAEVPWRVVVVDEAHRLRNVNSKLLECMRTVVTKGQVAYGYQHRVLMTGTPLQNNTLELWSLLNFVEPAKFPDLEKFQERYGNISTQEQVESLQRRIAPHLLRRVKEDVAKDIPPKEETIIDVELTTMQKQYYRAIFEHNHGFLMQNLKGSMPKLMNIQMELRKCCNHPFLINGVELVEMNNLEKTMEEALAQLPSKGRPKRISDTDFERRRMEEVMIPSSGKMVLLDKLLPKLLREGHKVLIFSQMVKMIDVIEEFCEFRKYPCERLDGRVGGNDRQKAIDRFNKDANSFVFLLSTRAGGVGINLTAADTVIIFDSDWNPQNDIQAMARCHRIGQSKNVTIYRLITRRSFESEMFERASKKLGLEQALLGTRDFNDADLDENARNNAKVDSKEMERLLREGAYSVLLDDDADIIKEFYEQDIDKILEQRAHVLVSDGGAPTESWLNKRKKSGRTNKSMFTGESAKEHAEIDVNDPDFWKKVLPDLVTPDLLLERLKDDSLLEDDENGRDGLEKFMRDISLMMEGMLDLNRRNQLPERERAVCLKLLLRMTLKEEVFDEDERSQAQEWLAVMEGTRSRRGRDVFVVEDSRKIGSRGGKGGRGGKGRGSRGGAVTPASVKKNGRGRKPASDDEEDEDDDDDLVDEAELSDASFSGKKRVSKKDAESASTPKSRSKGGAAPSTDGKKRVRRSKQQMIEDELRAKAQAEEDARLGKSTGKRKRKSKVKDEEQEEQRGDDPVEGEDASPPVKKSSRRTPAKSSSKASVAKRIRFTAGNNDGDEDGNAEDDFDREEVEEEEDVQPANGRKAVAVRDPAELSEMERLKQQILSGQFQQHAAEEEEQDPDAMEVEGSSSLQQEESTTYL